MPALSVVLVTHLTHSILRRTLCTIRTYDKRINVQSSKVWYINGQTFQNLILVER